MKIVTALCCVLLFGLTACALNSAAPRGGVAVTIAYPASPGAHFDWDYYLNNHVPMVSRLRTRSGTSLVSSCGMWQ